MRAAGRRGYHHGNLREALIRAALDLIAEKGPAGFTFADAARSAGVSSAAPYRHFRDRQALLADVARRGFEFFEERLDRAWNDGQPRSVSSPSRMSAGPISPLRAKSPPFIRRCSKRVCRSTVIPACAGRRPGLCGAAPRRRRVLRPIAERAPAAGTDDEPAFLGPRPRHRLAVCARRWRAPEAADVRRGAARSRGARLPARAPLDREPPGLDKGPGRPMSMLDTFT